MSARKGSEAPLVIDLWVPDGRGDVKMHLEIKRKQVTARHREVMEQVLQLVATLAAPQVVRARKPSEAPTTDGAMHERIAAGEFDDLELPV